MTPEKWQQVKTALESVLEAAPASRSRLLDDVCAGDDELRFEVESLLAFENTDDGSFTKSDFSAVIEEVFSEKTDAFSGRQIGRYKILREIGMGGMGAVYLAIRADGEFEQQVAVKFLRQNFASTTARQRFVQERQILARLQHRFIAQLIGGGTTDDGTPYLAMEYVEGIPIDCYCRNQNLTVAEKLDLFRKVCEAVSFAHRNLIVHRDLKPDNILITADGIPKLLDFGIAKLLSNTDVSATVTRWQALTPEYAAPEQIAGCAVTTAADIYALGIVLSEILTGTHPFKQTDSPPNSAWQAFLSNEPSTIRSPKSAQPGPKSKVQSPKLSENSKFAASRNFLRGDLDTIIHKALRREPERRYDSVERFSQDIKFYLKGFPISARPDTFRYRAGKFVSRNPLAVLALSVAVFSLLGGFLIAAYQARRADAERVRAEKRFAQVRVLANSFMFEINEKIGESPIQARELLVSRAVEYLDNLAEESDNDSDLQSELATSYEKIGDVQAELFKPTSGKTSDALASHRKSLQIRQKLFDAAPDNPVRGLDVVKSRLLIADILTMRGQIGEARAEYADTNEFSRRLLLKNPSNFSIRRNLASGYARLGQTVLRSGSLSEALANYEKSLEIYQTLSAENLSDSTLQRSTDIVLSYIGYVKMERGEFFEAVRFFKDSLAIEEKIAERQNDLRTRGYLGTAQLWVGVGLSEAGAADKAFPYIRQSLETQQEIFAADKNNFGEQNSLADCYAELGKALLKNNQLDSAIENLKKAAENYRIVSQADPENMPTRRQIAFSERYLAEAHLQKHDFKNALENSEKSLAGMIELTAADPTNAEWRYDLAQSYAQFGQILSSVGDISRAAENLQKAAPLLEKAAADSPENIYIRRDLEKLKINLAKLGRIKHIET